MHPRSLSLIRVGWVTVLLTSGAYAQQQGSSTAPATPTAGEGRTFPGWDLRADLIGRHPEIVRSEAFRGWSGAATIGDWYEETIEGRVTEVTIQDATNTKVFGALVLDRGTLAPVLLDTFFRDMSTLPVTRDRAIDILREYGRRDEIMVSPRARFHPPRIEWVLKSEAKTFVVQGTGKILQLPPVSSIEPFQTAPPDPVADDSLAENDLHHFSLIKTQAERWIAGVKKHDVVTKAEKIQEAVREFIYVSSDDTSKNYSLADQKIVIWADQKLLKVKGTPKGMCDEYAIVAVSALRAVGIRARIRYLEWTGDDGKRAAHACVEFESGKAKWMHMDPTYRGVFNEPGFYRNELKVTDIEVLNADFPEDDRSQADPDNDDVLHQYDDFVITTTEQGVPSKDYTGKP